MGAGTSNGPSYCRDGAGGAETPSRARYSQLDGGTAGTIWGGGTAETIWGGGTAGTRSVGMQRELHSGFNKGI